MRSQTLAGYAVGGGAEWAVTPAWSVKAEYLYYDLGSLKTSGGSSIYKIRRHCGVYHDAIDLALRWPGRSPGAKLPC